MKIHKIKVDELTELDLIKEAFSIPYGWHEEVYVENGEVEFSTHLTKNTWIGKADCPSEQLDSYVGDLHSLSVNDFEGLKKRDDGQIELAMESENDDYNGSEKIKGEYYDLVQIISIEEAEDIIIDQLTDDSEYAQLIKTIQGKEA